MNHVLKQKADWKSQRIAELITLIETNVKSQYKDVERAMVKLRPFYLVSAFTKFEISYHDWSQKNENERKKNLEDFMNHFPKTKSDSISTNGKLITFVPSNTCGKKPNRKKRRAEKSFSKDLIKILKISQL